MALRVYFERPATAAEVDREAERLQHAIAETGPADAALRRLARARLERVQRLKSNVAAWLLAMIVLTPVNVLIEWQDNGGFQRISRDSQPGSWDPWILFAGAHLGRRHRRGLRAAGVPRPPEDTKLTRKDWSTWSAFQASTSA